MIYLSKCAAFYTAMLPSWQQSDEELNWCFYWNLWTVAVYYSTWHFWRHIQFAHVDLL